MDPLNTRRIYLFLVFSLQFCFTSSSQDKPNNVGSIITIQSHIMDDVRELQIYLPDEYADSNKKYPVLYVLDGQRYFLHAVSLLQSFMDFDQTPAFIIVGISKNNSDRNSIFTSKANTYFDFLKNEVIATVDSQFRTSNSRLLFGWAFSGGFVLETMLSQADLFNAYIAASPFPIENKILRIDSLILNNPGFNKLIFFTCGLNEGVVKEGAYKLHTLLEEKLNGNNYWKFLEFEHGEHRSTPYNTLYHGIRKYFHYYPELQFNSLEAFIESGGLEYTYDYYQKRSDQYGLPKELTDWTMFSLVRNAIRANNYTQFNILVTEFNPTGFIGRLRDTRACSIARFYLANAQYQQAIQIFLGILEQHPNSIPTLKGLGDTYTEMGDKHTANTYYEQANSQNN